MLASHLFHLSISHQCFPLTNQKIVDKEAKKFNLLDQYPTIQSRAEGEGKDLEAKIKITYIDSYPLKAEFMFYHLTQFSGLLLLQPLSVHCIFTHSYKHSVQAYKDVPRVLSTGFFNSILCLPIVIDGLCINAETTDGSVNFVYLKEYYYCWSPHQGNFQINIHGISLVLCFAQRPDT